MKNTVHCQHCMIKLIKFDNIKMEETCEIQFDTSNISTFSRWFATNVMKYPSFNKEIMIDAYDNHGQIIKIPLIQVGLVMANCHKLPDGKFAENKIKSDPVMFIDIKSCLGHIYNHQTLPFDHEKMNKIYCLPICLLHKYPELVSLMSKCYALYMTHENESSSSHDMHNIFIGSCTAMYNICNSLSEEISFEKINLDSGKITFLIMALHVMMHVMKSIIKYNNKNLNTFVSIINTITSSTTSMIESIMLSVLIDVHQNSMITTQYIGSSIYEYFISKTNKSYLITPPTNLINILYVIPIIKTLSNVTLDDVDSIHRIVGNI